MALIYVNTQRLFSTVVMQIKRTSYNFIHLMKKKKNFISQPTQFVIKRAPENMRKRERERDNWESCIWKLNDIIFGIRNDLWFIKYLMTYNNHSIPRCQIVSAYDFLIRERHHWERRRMWELTTGATRISEFPGERGTTWRAEQECYKVEKSQKSYYRRNSILISSMCEWLPGRHEECAFLFFTVLYFSRNSYYIYTQSYLDCFLHDKD